MRYEHSNICIGAKRNGVMIKTLVRSVLKSAIALGIGFVLFAAMQVLGARPCYDCGTKVGFPFSYMQGGTYGTHGHVIWPGFVADFSIALCIGILVVWIVAHRKLPANAQK